MKIRLLQDVYSSVSKGLLYGAAGEEVLLIREVEGILLVQGLRGSFPVKRSYTNYDNPEAEVVKKQAVEKEKAPRVDETGKRRFFYRDRGKGKAA